MPTGTAPSPITDFVCAVPFSQIRERGFDVVDGGESILCLEVQHSERIDESELKSLLPSRQVKIAGSGGFDWDDEHYGEVIRRIIQDEIERGAGSNFVVPREFRDSITGFDLNSVLSIFVNLLEHEYGAYWTFVLYVEDTFLVGASPERLISCADGVTMMNPISGTFRKADSSPEQFPDALRRFLADEKEIYELFMVVDEELKVMAEICPRGGRIAGPYLKEMSHLIHTEYLLAGQSSLPMIDQFRESMFAATVIGSPMQNACRVVKRYRDRPRRYYGSAVVTFGRNQAGPVMDSAITIRTAEIDAHGNMSVQVGATLVRNSAPEYEVQETHAKIAGLLTAAGITSRKSNIMRYSELLASDMVRYQLVARNEWISRFWFVDQEVRKKLPLAAPLAGKHIVIYDFEDNFTRMLAHILSSLGAAVRILSWDQWAPDKLAGDLVILGPGPGDPANSSDPRIATGQRAARYLLQSKRPFLAVCLGHQILSQALGLELFRKERPTQGTQATVELFGKPERVGFYNTFAARYSQPIESVEISALPDGEIYATRGRHFVSFQFHVESILTENGPEILAQALSGILV